MSPAELRLECLRLAYRHDKDPSEILDRAAVLDKFVQALVLKAPAPAPTKGDTSVVNRRAP